MTPPPLPRHLGLSRRQSYDPLSTTKSLSQSLHLGTLPSPQFVHLPAGQRSVPATESSLRNIGGYRSASGSGLMEAKEGPRTPGGSLVIGAEVFGFGTHKGSAKGASGRWGDGTVGNEESDEQEGREWATNGFENGGMASPAIGEGGEFQLGSSGLAGDVNGTVHPSFGITNGQRSAALVHGDTIERPSSTQSGTIHSRAQSSTPLPTPAAVAGQGFNSAAYPGYTDTSTNGNGGWNDPNRPPTFGNFDPQLQSQETSADDLSFGMRNLNMGGAADPSLAYLTAPRRTPSSTNGSGSSPYNSYVPRDPQIPGQDRQGSTQYSNYYLQQPSSYPLQTDPYAAYTDSYYNSTNEHNSQDQATGYPSQQQQSFLNHRSQAPPHLRSQNPSWSPSPAFPTDFSPFPSRAPSFSYTPTLSANAHGPYGLAPGGSFLTMDAAGGVSQQQAILLGRGMRSAVDYIAPGPPPSSMGGYGYEYGGGRFEGGGRHEGVVRSPMLEEFRGNRHRSWELVDLVNHIVEFSGDQL